MIKFIHIKKNNETNITIPDNRSVMLRIIPSELRGGEMISLLMIPIPFKNKESRTNPNGGNCGI